MAVNKAMFVGTDAIMSRFDEIAETPYWSFWQGKTLTQSWNQEDGELGRHKLEEAISAAEVNGCTDVFTLRFHPEKDQKGWITEKSPTYASFTLRPMQLEPTATLQGIAPGNYEMRQMMEKLNAIESRLNGEEAMGEIEEVAAPAIWQQLLLDPVKLGQMIDLATGVAAQLGTAFRGKPLVGVSGIAPDGEVMAIVDSLMSKGVTIDHLRKLNDMSSLKLSSLLLML